MTKTKFYLAMAACMALLLPAAARAGVITVNNASFETPVLSSGTYITPGLSTPATAYGWTWSGSTGIAAENGTWFYGAPANGVQAAYFQQGGSISQSISGLTVGQNYVVSLYVAQRPYYGPNFPTQFTTYVPATINVTMGGQSLGNYTPQSLAFTGVTTSLFTATATSATLAISALSTCSCDADTSLDMVSVLVPEPSSLAILGSAVLGLLGMTGASRKMSGGRV